MDLQQRFYGARFYPFPVSSIDFDDLFHREKPSIPDQRNELLFADETDPWRKEESALSVEAITVIGENGRRRFEEFSRYNAGWYGGVGKKLSKWSVSIFERFIKEVPELKVVRPSLFLTFEGNLQLGWTNKSGHRIELDFLPDKIEYFIEPLDQDESVKLADIFKLTEKIRTLLN